MIFPTRFRKFWNLAASLITGGAAAPPLSYTQALEFFDQLAAREDLALGYPEDGCFSRCHMMCEAAFDKGYTPKKAWAVDYEGGNLLSFTLPSGRKTWTWAHAALALSVKSPSGEIRDLVFDPAFFDGPVSLYEWGESMNALPHYPEIKPFGKAPTQFTGNNDTNFPGDYDTRWTTAEALSDPNHSRHPVQDLLSYKSRETFPRVVLASQYCREYIFPALGHWPERRGKNWVSADPSPHTSRPSASPGHGDPNKPLAR